jgi:transposase
MPGPLSKDLRKRVIEAVASGTSRRQAARRFGVSASAAVRWLAAWQEEGRMTPLAMGGDRRSSLVRHRKLLLEMIAAQPDTTIGEMRAMLEAKDVATSYGALWRFFAREGMSFKKNGPCQRAGTAGGEKGP